MENSKEIGVESPHSVEISYTKDGRASGKCKCYGATPGEALDEAVKLSEEVLKLIRAKNGI